MIMLILMVSPPLLAPSQQVASLSHRMGWIGGSQHSKLIMETLEYHKEWHKER